MKKTIDFKSIKNNLTLVPFFGEPVAVQLRVLTQAQISACGGDKFSLIKLDEDITPKATMENRVQFAEIMHEITKQALVSPTYDEIINQLIDKKEHDRIGKELDEIERKLFQMPHGKMRTELETKYDGLRMWYDLILPEDFLSAVTTYSLGTTRSDIKNVTKEGLIRAAVLAKNGHDNPADHLKGEFTDFNRDDINSRAWALFYEQQKKKKGAK